MREILLWLAAAMAAVSLSGCSSLGRLDTSSTGPAPSESIIMIGVAPENFTVSLFRGSVSGERFNQGLLPATLYGVGQQGFLVGKADAGDTLGLTIVRELNKPSDILGGRLFSPCGDAHAMVYDIPKGKVLYLGSVRYASDGSRLRVSREDDLDAARRHLREKYPKVTGELEVLEPRLMPVTQACGPGIPLVIPIYIPRSR
ncbi:hypothetical protein ACQ86G_19620 [Roseateles chitinivorans]|uniref:hypothetical protein n=1 Tax=Roseateles chitinivorans TaxID=2917965 RepID=UPI003D67A829